jgi:hypothetical protein
MVFRLQTRGWRKNPPVPLYTYAELLSDALLRLRHRRDVEAIITDLGIIVDDQPWTEAEAQAIFQEFNREFSVMVGAVEQLEEIKPTHEELLNLHVRAVGYLRGLLTYFDRDSAAAMQLIVGNMRESAKHRKDADDWFKTLVGVRDQFAKELLQVRLHYRSLYDGLNLPEEILEGWGLR